MNLHRLDAASRVVRDALAAATCRLPRDDLARLARSAGRDVVRVAAEHRVAGLVERHLDGIDGIEGAVRADLEARRAHAVGVHLRAVADLSTLAAVLDAACLPWAVFKGPVLAAALWPEPGLRSYDDVDVLVSPSVFGDCLDALERQGWVVLDRNWPLVHRLRPGELHLLAPYGSFFDLHWDLVPDALLRREFRLGTDAVLHRRRPVGLGQLTALTFDPEDTLIHLATHACASGGDRLVWMNDVRLAADVPNVDWDVVIRRARAGGVALAVGVMLQRAGVVTGAPIDARVLQALMPPGWRAASRVVDALSPVGRMPAGASAARVVARGTRSTAVRSILEVARRSASWAAAGRDGRAPERRRSSRDPTDPSCVLFDTGDPAGRNAFVASVSDRLG